MQRVARQWWMQDALCRDPLRKQPSASIIRLVSELSLIHRQSVWLPISGNPMLPSDTPGINNGLARLSSTPLPPPPGSQGSKIQELLGQTPCSLDHMNDTLPPPPRHTHRHSALLSARGSGTDQEAPKNSA